MSYLFSLSSTEKKLPDSYAHTPHIMLHVHMLSSMLLSFSVTFGMYLIGHSHQYHDLTFDKGLTHYLPWFRISSTLDLF
jgi:hypothetical protein